MTNASQPTTAETVELSTEHRLFFLTGNEVRDLEAEPTLTARDVWGDSA